MSQPPGTRTGLRTAMAAAGVATIAFYTVAAYLVVLLARFVWTNRPDMATLAWVFLAAMLVSGYLTYRFGTGRTLTGLDARELPRERAPTAHRIVDALTAEMGVARPRVYVARLGEPNALSLGGRSSALVVDYSLFRLLSAAELEGVLAHEFAHIEGRDSLVQTFGHSVVHTVVGVVALALAPLAFVAGGFARGLALVRGDPERWHRTVPGRLQVGLTQVLTLLLIGLTVFLRAYSRRREHAADDRAVEVTGRPLALARALRKIDRSRESTFPFAPLYRRQRVERHPISRLLSTHPPMEERIDRLRRRAASAGHSAGRTGGLGGGGSRRGESRDGLHPGRPNRGDDGWTRIPIGER